MVHGRFAGLVFEMAWAKSQGRKVDDSGFRKGAATFAWIRSLLLKCVLGSALGYAGGMFLSTFGFRDGQVLCLQPKWHALDTDSGVESSRGLPSGSGSRRGQSIGKGLARPALAAMFRVDGWMGIAWLRTVHLAALRGGWAWAGEGCAECDGWYGPFSRN